jgi:phosphomevalonate kinase
MKTKYQVQTGGKLYLAGEYAVLTPGCGAVIQFIPIYLSATIQEANTYQLVSDLFGYKVDLTPNKDYALIQETIQLMEEWLKDQGIAPKPLDLHLRGTLGEEGKKYGIGSSGSVVLLVIKAMAALYEIDLSPDLLFRLAAVVLVQRGDNGSMGDLACIAYEDLIYYQSFDRAWLHEVLTSQPLSQVLALDWHYQIRVIQPAISYDFLAGWTKEPAISSDLIRRVKSAIDKAFLKESQSAVEKLEKGLREGNQKGIKTSIERADQNLKALNPLIYTPALKELQQATDGLSACAKSSGAGGGDCGIALSFDPLETQTLIERWTEKKIEIIYQERIGDS